LLIADTLSVSDLLDEPSKTKALELINEIVVFHNELIDRANHPEGKKNSREVKKYYRRLGNDLLTGCHSLYGKITGLIPE